jgi:hypothetical protein
MYGSEPPSETTHSNAENEQNFEEPLHETRGNYSRYTGMEARKALKCKLIRLNVLKN